MKNLTRSETAGILLAHDNYAIVTHRRPDGDTLGSSAVLCMGLRQLGKNAHILTNPEITPKYTHLHTGLCKPKAEAGDFVISVDVASEKMLPDIFLGCGKQDELVIAASRKYNEAMKALGHPITFYEREGLHDHTFWKQALTPLCEFLTGKGGK